MSSASIGCSPCAWITTSTAAIGEREIVLEAEWLAHAATQEHRERRARAIHPATIGFEDQVSVLLAEDGDEIEWRKL